MVGGAKAAARCVHEHAVRQVLVLGKRLCGIVLGGGNVGKPQPFGLRFDQRYAVCMKVKRMHLGPRALLGNVAAFAARRRANIQHQPRFAKRLPGCQYAGLALKAEKPVLIGGKAG